MDFSQVKALSIPVVTETAGTQYTGSSIYNVIPADVTEYDLYLKFSDWSLTPIAGLDAKWTYELTEPCTIPDYYAYGYFRYNNKYLKINSSGEQTYESGKRVCPEVTWVDKSQATELRIRMSSDALYIESRYEIGGYTQKVAKQDVDGSSKIVSSADPYYVQFLAYTPITTTETQAVNKISKDGTTLWMSYAACPYRQLEYIHFNGNAYINIDYNFATSRTHEMDFSLDEGNIADATCGVYRADTFKWVRFYFPRIANVTAANRYQIRLSVGGGWSTASDNFSMQPDLRYRLSATAGSSMTAQVSAKLVTVNSGYTQSTTLTPTITSANPNTSSGVIYVGAQHNDDNVLNYVKMKLYGYKGMNAAMTETYRSYIPAQRKSDGRCGLYSTATNRFYPMEGTGATLASNAGPTVNEYPNW